MSKGVIFKALSGFYYVDTPEGEVECRARGKFRLDRISPLVGDEVEVCPLGNGQGTLSGILPRRNSFIRPAVANIDLMIILASAVIPVTDPFLVDRIAAIAELKDCRPVICINKCDLDRGDLLFDTYKRAGFDTVRTSAVTGEGLEELQSFVGTAAPSQGTPAWENPACSMRLARVFTWKRERSVRSSAEGVIQRGTLKCSD